MTAIWFGLLAALAWGVSTVAGTKLVRSVGTVSALAVSMVIGLALVAPFAAAAGSPSASAAAWAWGASAGLGYVSAMGCWLLAVRHGKVSLVTPIVSADGATAALIAVVAFGETLARGVGAALGLIVLGVVVAGIRPDTGTHGRFTGRELTLAVGAALLFGCTFVAGAEAQEQLGVAWTLAASRATAVAAIAPAALVIGGVRAFRLPRAAIKFAVAMAALDMSGYAAFLAGAAGNVAIAAVLASQYAVVAIVGGFVAFGERLTRLQATGVVLTLVGIAALTSLQA